MSAEKTEAPPNKQNTLPGGTSDPYGFARIDRRIERLKEILPPVPYILDIPAHRRPKDERRYPYEWRRGWHNGHPFQPDEEPLQYLSFFSHLVWEDSVILPIGDWDDGNGRIRKEEPETVDKHRSNPATPQLGATTAKKKMTMADYLNRKKNGDLSRPPSQQSNSSSAADEDSMEKKTERQAKNMGNDISPKTSKEALPTQINGGDLKARTTQSTTKKRPLEDDSKNRPSATNDKDDTGSRRPEKKPRLDHTAEESRPESLAKKAVPDIPRELSPTLPPSLSSDLPGILSPTLPPTIEKALKELPAVPNGASVHKNQGPLHAHRSEKKAALETQGKSKATDSPKPNAATPRAGNGIKETSKSTQSPRPRPADVDKPKAHKPSDSDISQKSIALNGLKSASLQDRDRRSDSKPERKQSRTVKLKYGRKNRKTVDRILRMKPQPKKILEDTPFKKDLNEDSKATKDSKSLKEKSSKPDVNAETRQKPALPRPAKRPRPAEEDEPSASNKRQKLPPNLNLDKPPTPVPTAFKSPAPSKTQFFSPKKDLKSVAMRRVDSGDGDPRTPSGLRSGTPTAPNSVDRASSVKTGSPNPSSHASGRQERKVLWREQSGKYITYGRSLKHEADKYLRTEAEDKKKLGFVLAIESILCYFIAFSGYDEANTLSTGKPPLDPSAWMSVVPYYDVIRNGIDDFPELRGLLVHLGALLCDTIHSIDMEKLLHDPLPKLPSDDTSTPSDPGNMTPNTAQATEYHQKYVKFKKSTVTTYHKAKALWVEAARELPVQKIRNDFPMTWAKRELDITLNGRVRYLPGKFDGSFFLPLNGTSNPMEAVSFGQSFLAEWCAKEKIKWEPKIGT